MALEGYKINRISYNLAMFYVVKMHYLHRKAPCSHAFGLFKDGVVKGVIVYGTPSSCTLRSGIAGEENADNVIELTRLWVDESVPRNGESFLIGNTLKMLDKEIVVSYAEQEEGHVGFVYQATNWIYTGLSEKRTNWVVEGVDKHNTTLVDKYSAKEIREKFGDKFTLEERSRKHRYVYFACDRRRKRALKKQMRYPILPYPKTVVKKEMAEKEIEENAFDVFFN